MAPLDFATTEAPDGHQAGATLRRRVAATRAHSMALAAPLTAEDMVVQASDDASPTKWHLAHVTWFFETFVLMSHLPGYRLFDESFPYCFNSYYESLGPRQPRALRGLLTRPPMEQVFAYRRHVDAALDRLLEGPVDAPLARLIEVGIHHEQQHQELLLTDILVVLASQPLRPCYAASERAALTGDERVAGWLSFDGGIHAVGHVGAAFAWDNETPRHDALIRPFALADRLVTNGEWLAFIADGGYRRPELWLADGWATVRREEWDAPLYWRQTAPGWHAMSLYGEQAVVPAEPVCHVSYFEADAFARWAGARLPTEFEWEMAAADCAIDAPQGVLRPAAATPGGGRLRQLYGAAWQWTQSAYAPYPGYRPPAGALGEYNGKFMVSQQVLRGSSCVTPAGHARPTYRNFFYPPQRWQFTGVRLARDAA